MSSARHAILQHMPPKSRPVADAQEAAALMQSAAGRGRGRKSPVLVWLTENREVIAAAIAKSGPAWGVLATYLAEKQVLDGDGRPPSARNVREAWARVQATAHAVASEPAEGPFLTVRPVVHQSEDDLPTESASSRFRPAGLRNHTPSVPQAAPPERPAPVKRDADAEIARLLGSRPTRSFPSPDTEE